MMKKETVKGLEMSPKRALLSRFSFTLSHYIKHIEKTIKTRDNSDMTCSYIISQIFLVVDIDFVQLLMFLQHFTL